MKNFYVREKVFDEQWTFYGARHGLKRQDLWVWNCLVDGVPYFVVGDRSLWYFEVVLPRGGVNFCDDYQVYQVLDDRVVGKRYTFRVEGYGEELFGSF